jgi:predicted SAM-dependent methyltransferase
MTFASSLSPTTKERLRPYWRRYTRARAAVDAWVEATSLVPRIWTRKLVQRLTPIRIPEAANGSLNLHIGCGKVNHPAFVNIDGYPWRHVHLVQSIKRLGRFRSGTADLIYASHCLEHIGHHETIAVLTEWNRVLKKGGVLRLSVPDFDKLVGIYQQHGRDPDVVMSALMGGQKSLYNFHYTALNDVNLTRALLAAGFSVVRAWQPGGGPLTTFPDFSIHQAQVEGRAYPISLNLEAVK